MPEGKRGLQLIGSFKLVKGIVLIASGIALMVLGKDPARGLSMVVQHLSVDPHARYFQALVQQLVQVSPRLPLVAVGVLFYGAIFCVEGIGLLLQQHWAEWLTTIVTGSFIPLEIYEMKPHMSALKGVIIVVNIAIVAYLIVRLRGEGTSAALRPAPTP